MQDVPSLPAPEDLVGRPVWRLWPSKGWYAAVVAGWDAGTGRHTLVFQGGTPREMHELMNALHPPVQLAWADPALDPTAPPLLIPPVVGGDAGATSTAGTARAAVPGAANGAASSQAQVGGSNGDGAAAMDTGEGDDGDDSSGSETASDDGMLAGAARR